jgi:hypothetical protein
VSCDDRRENSRRGTAGAYKIWDIQLWPIMVIYGQLIPITQGFLQFFYGRIWFAAIYRLWFTPERSKVRSLRVEAKIPSEETKIACLAEVYRLVNVQDGTNAADALAKETQLLKRKGGVEAVAAH